MRRYRRLPRRQGVVYGPPRVAGGGDDGGAFGRLLGPVVILGAFALLAAGAWAYLGRSGAPLSSPSPTSQAFASPTMTATPAASPTPTIGPSPTPTATLPPTPSPTPFEIAVVEGPGAITFGTQFERGSLRIIDPQTTFARRGRMFSSAHLTEAAGAPELRITVNRYDPETGTETLVNEHTWDVDNQRATIFLRRFATHRFVDGEPGIYVMRYLRDEILLAEGYFEIE